jgi:cytoskeletal protein RodZ
MDVAEAVAAFFKSTRDVVGFAFSGAKSPNETAALPTSSTRDASAGLLTASQRPPNFKTDQTLGQLLTEAREQRGISRERIAEEIHIPGHYLRMIESGIYDAVPDELYLVPFIRRYAAFLGLDAPNVVSRFIQDFEKAENEIVVQASARAKDARTLRISIIGSAALLAAVLLHYIGSRSGSLPVTVAHPALTPSVTATQNKKGASGPSMIPGSQAASTGASAVTIPTPAPEAVTLTEPAPMSTPESNQQAPVKHRPHRYVHRRSHRRRHRAR